METLTLNAIAAACGASCDQVHGLIEVDRIITDSRHARPRDLFVALRGERFDGHDFLKEVAARGVAGVLVDEKQRALVPKSVPTLAVSAPRVAYGQIAGHYRRKFDIPMVCVGGSNGKTTTKDLIACVLRAKAPTLNSEASFNNDVGVPATLLQLDARFGSAVLEVGTNHPGELAPLVHLIAPQIGVITSIGREHLEFFKDLRGVVQEEGALAAGLPPGGMLILDGDSPTTPEIAERRRPGVGVVRVGYQTQNEWQIRSISQDWSGLSFQVHSTSRPSWTGVWRVPLSGVHSARNAVYALATGAELGVDPAAARTALATFQPPKQRLALTQAGGVRLIDDTYNANADSMLAALQTLTDLPCAGRRVAVLGDMSELGFMTETAHVEVGHAAAKAADALFAIGQHAELTVKAARASGLRRAESFAELDPAIAVVAAYLQPGDSVLVKASRSARLERVVAALRQHFSPASPESTVSAAA